MLKVNNSSIKINRNLYKGSVFNFFKFNIISKKNFSLVIWNFLSTANMNNFFILKKLAINYNFFNYSKNILIFNKPNRSSIYIFDNNLLVTKLVISFFYSLLKQLNKSLFAFNHGWVYRLNFIGIGYKIFLYKNYLYLKLGYCRLIRLEIPHDIKLFCRKRNRLLLLSDNYSSLDKFVFKIKKLRKFNFYKGKGIFELSSFDNIKLKVGKQQQFY